MKEEQKEDKKKQGMTSFQKFIVIAFFVIVGIAIAYLFIDTVQWCYDSKEVKEKGGFGRINSFSGFGNVAKTTYPEICNQYIFPLIK